MSAAVTHVRITIAVLAVLAILGDAGLAPADTSEAEQLFRDGKRLMTEASMPRLALPSRGVKRSHPASTR